MALIICPECGGKVSDQAVVCIHCGYPLKQEDIITTDNVPTEIERGPFALVLYDVGPKKIKCGSQIVHVLNVKAKQATAMCDDVEKNHKEITLAIEDNETMLADVKRGFEEFGCGVKIVDIGIGAEASKNYIVGEAVARRVSQQNIPKCPTCGSTRISKISNLNRAASVAAFGGMSKKINKSFKCDNCGYTW